MALRHQDHGTALTHPGQNGLHSGPRGQQQYYMGLEYSSLGPAWARMCTLCGMINGCGKAFDRVKWVYMMKVLRGIVLGKRMMSWVLALYRDPRAQLKANGTLSDHFSITQWD